MKPKIIVVMPAYNAARTLRRTVEELPAGFADEVILVDDASVDGTPELAIELGLTVYVHPVNRGYGGNQKTCYTHALAHGADIVVMLHPDYQYDPRLAPSLVRPVVEGEADLVLGSRLLDDKALQGKMPLWKYVGNRVLTGFENVAFGASFAEYHTGYRAFHRRLLKTVPFLENSDGFVFDQQIIAQTLMAGFRIHEVPIPTRYFKEASSVSFRNSVVYGLRTLGVLVEYRLHRHQVRQSVRFAFSAPASEAIDVVLDHR